MQPTSYLMHNAEETTSRLEKARDEYLSKRASLEEAHIKTQKLRQSLRDNSHQVTIGKQQAEAAIRAAGGDETAEAVEMAEMSIRKERQCAVLERMVAEEEPTVEFLQIEAYGARISYDRALKQARRAACHSEIRKQADALFSSEAAAPLLRLLPALQEEATAEVFGSTPRLFSYGIDGEMIKATGTPSSAAMSSAQLEEAEGEARNQQMIAIGELVYPHIEKPDFDAVSELGSLLRPIEPLDCEESGEKWGNSGVAISRRRKELVALLGESAA